MKRFAQIVIATILLGSLTVTADPFKTWNWDGPTEYENNMPIPVEDTLSFNLLCGATEGGPYTMYEALMQPIPPSIEDMESLVQNTPGTYYCVATATSSLHGSTSVHSNEVNFTVLPTDIGLTPKSPVLFFR